MRRLERLGGTSGFSFVSYGVHIGIRTNDESVLERITEHLPPGWQPSSSEALDEVFLVRVGGTGRADGRRRLHSLYDRNSRILRTHDREELFSGLENSIHLWVAEWAKERLFVHAGVVGYNGRALVLPGKSFAGKTTLVRALLKAGASYYSDEAAVLDDEGLVHPYARKLSVREVPGERPRRYDAAALGAQVGQAPLPVGAVVLSEFRPGAEWSPARLSPGEAVLALLANTVPARERPQAAFSVLSRVASRAPAFKGVRSEADAIVDELLSYLSQ